MIKIQKEIEQFPNNAKLWFYWIPRPLLADEVDYFQQSKKDFLSQWNTHGKPNAADVWLIEIDGKPIIAHVIDMFPGELNFIFICKDSASHLTSLTTRK
jgi:hypothetical protein